MKLSHLIKLIIFIYFCSFSRICFSGNNLIKEIANIRGRFCLSICLRYICRFVCRIESVFLSGWYLCVCVFVRIWCAYHFHFTSDMNANQINVCGFCFNILTQEIQLCLLLQVFQEIVSRSAENACNISVQWEEMLKSINARRYTQNFLRYVNLFCVTRLVKVNSTLNHLDKSKICFIRLKEWTRI